MFLIAGLTMVDISYADNVYFNNGRVIKNVETKIDVDGSFWVSGIKFSRSEIRNISQSKITKTKKSWKEQALSYIGKDKISKDKEAYQERKERNSAVLKEVSEYTLRQRKIAKANEKAVISKARRQKNRTRYSHQKRMNKIRLGAVTRRVNFGSRIKPKTKNVVASNPTFRFDSNIGKFISP